MFPFEHCTKDHFANKEEPPHVHYGKHTGQNKFEEIKLAFLRSPHVWNVGRIFIKHIVYAEWHTDYSEIKPPEPHLNTEEGAHFLPLGVACSFCEMDP